MSVHVCTNETLVFGARRGDEDGGGPLEKYLQWGQSQLSQAVAFSIAFCFPKTYQVWLSGVKNQSATVSN